MALAQGRHFRDFAHWIRPWLCPSGDLEWWAPPFNPSSNDWAAEVRFTQWRAQSIWFVMQFTETENCDWLALHQGRFRITWVRVNILWNEMCSDYYAGIQDHQDRQSDSDA